MHRPSRLMATCLCMVLAGGCAQARTGTPTRGPGVTWTRLADAAEMIHVPDGWFLMGSPGTDDSAGADEKPAHNVYLSAFWEDDDSHILWQQDRYVVESGFEDHPVTEVTWYGAQAYCERAGGKLPTEAEWEKAARGATGRLYPWGNRAPHCDQAQYGDCGGSTVPAGSRPAGASPYGVLDMAGNVWEWVADWYDPAYYDSSPARNPQGPAWDERKVFRGGSWGYPPTFLRTSDRARNRPAYAGPNVGFRCAAPTR